MPQVTMPDGAVVDMPDQLTPELGSRLRAFQTGKKPETDTSFGHMALGAGENAAAAIGNVIPGIANAATDFVSRGTGHGGFTPVPTFPVGQAGKDFGETSANALTEGIDRLSHGVGDALTSGAGATKDFADTHPKTMNAVHMAGDAAALIPGVKGLGVAASDTAGAARGFRSLLGGDGFDTEGAVGNDASGLRSGAGQDVAKAVAGDSGKHALQEHNQQVGNTIAAGEANHVAEAPLSYEATKAARQGPNDVYTRVGANLPEGQLDQAAQEAIASTGAGNKLVTASETAQKQIDNLKSQLQNKSFTGDQLIDNLRSLRQEGYKRAGSEDVDQQAVGNAQLDLARALEGHVERNLPKGGDVTVQDFQAARKALAKNHAVEGALHGPDVDLKAVARMQRADPHMLDGGLKDIADFANGEGRNAVGLPDTYHTPSFAADAAGLLDLHKPVQSIGQFFGGKLARSALTGDTAAAVDAARSRFPAPNRFDPRPGLTAPPGRAGRDPVQLGLGDLPQGPGPSPFTLGEGANPSPSAPGGGQGGIPLADLLAHGVEQSPPAGLSLAPMEAPPQQGLPFHADAGHMAGDLSLDHGPPLADLLADLHDHPAVMSQGVPEGTAARAPQRRFVGDTVDFPGGTSRRQVIENNASGESSASLEAQRRLASERSTGSAPFMIDPEGVPKPVAHTTDAVDVKAPKGHLKVQLDPSTGKLSIMDRGGLTLQAARGLLNRYTSLHGTKLGDAFGS
jgi:hypothetical protein